MQVRETTIFGEEENIGCTGFRQLDSQFSKKFPDEGEPPPPKAALPRRATLIVCLQGSIDPINKARDGWAVKLYKLLISRETYTSGKDAAEPQESDPPSFLPSFLPSTQPTSPASSAQPTNVQVVTGVFNKVNFKTPARTEINFNAGYRLSPARSESLLRTNVGNGCERGPRRANECCFKRWQVFE